MAQPKRTPAHVPASGANSSAFLDTPAAAAAPSVDHDALSVILVTAGYDHTIRFWEAWSGVCSRTIQHPDSQVNRLAISPDKKLLAVAGHSHVRLYDTAGSSVVTPAPGGRAAEAGGRHNASHGATAPLMSFDGHTNNITALAWHCDAKWLVSGSEDGTLRIWDTRYVHGRRRAAG